MADAYDIVICPPDPNFVLCETIIEQVEERTETMPPDPDSHHEMHAPTPSESIVTPEENVTSTMVPKIDNYTQICDDLRSIKADVKNLIALLCPSAQRLARPSTGELTRVVPDQAFYQQIISRSPNKTPTFSGKPTEGVRHFLLSIEKYTNTVYCWSQEILLRFISFHLTDKALDWYYYRPQYDRRFTDWQDFTVQFLAHFLCPMRLRQRQDEWDHCVQQDGENINDFVLRLGSLWLDARPKENETDLVKHIFCKMRLDLLGFLRFSLSASLESTLADASHAEAILLDRQQIQLEIEYEKSRSARLVDHDHHSPQSNALPNYTPTHRRRGRASQRPPFSSSRFSHYETDCYTNHNGNPHPRAYRQQFHN